MMPHLAKTVNANVALTKLPSGPANKNKRIISFGRVNALGYFPKRCSKNTANKACNAAPKPSRLEYAKDGTIPNPSGPAKNNPKLMSTDPKKIPGQTELPKISKQDIPTPAGNQIDAKDPGETARNNDNFAAIK